MPSVDFKINTFRINKVKNNEPFYSQEQKNGESLTNSININNSNKLESIGPYLAGLLEGDGHIVLSKSITEGSKLKKTSPYIAITFVNKDLLLINK